VRVEAVPLTGREKPQTFVLPAPAVQLLLDIMTHLAAGEPVAVIPNHAELTTQEAADFLNVSRPWVVGLIERGELPHRVVGTHRRILFADLRAYKEQLDARRDRALDELAELGQAMGGYE